MSPVETFQNETSPVVSKGDNVSFKKIPGFLGYTVDRNGTVKRNGRTVKSRPDDDGYNRVDLYRDGKRSTKFVHRLVNQVHNGGTNKEVDHKNRDRTDNSANNLRPATRKQNNNNKK